MTINLKRKLNRENKYRTYLNNLGKYYNRDIPILASIFLWLITNKQLVLKLNILSNKEFKMPQVSLPH